MDEPSAWCDHEIDPRNDKIEDEAIKEDGTCDHDGGMYSDSDDDDGDDDDDDESGEGVSEYGMHDPTVHWKKMRPHFGERFANQEQLRFCLTNYAVARGLPIKVVKSSAERLQVKCGTDSKGKKCPFNMRASWMNNERSFQVKGINTTHTCIRDFRHATLVNPEWIANHFIKHLCMRPKMRGREIREAVKKKFLCEVSIGQCYRAKKKALEIINGKLTDNCTHIWDYAEEISRSNPDGKRRRHVTEDDGGYKRLRATGGKKICTNCWQCGHNKRTCKNPTKPPPQKEKKKIGRPLKNTQRKENQRRTESVTISQRKDNEVRAESVEGLHDVPVVLTFKGHAYAQDLLGSDYLKDEVIQALDDEMVQVDVVADVDMVAETQVGEGIEETVKRRKKSERIIKAKLGKKLTGPGATSGDPLTLE